MCHRCCCKTCGVRIFVTQGRTLRRVVRITVRPARFRNDGSGISGISITRGRSATRVHGRLRAFLNRESRFQLQSTGEHSHAPPPRSRETKGIGLRAHVSVYSDEPFERDYHAVVLSRTFKVIRETVALSRWEGDRPAAPPALRYERIGICHVAISHAVFEFMRSRVHTYRI